MKTLLQTVFIVFAVALADAAISSDEHGHEPRTEGNSSSTKQSASNSDFLETMKKTMTGKWSGRYTNGTFEKPAGWLPVIVEYRLTANETAIIEDYIDPKASNVLMSTVYFRDRDDLRLTHYCGAANHPSMLATSLDADDRKVDFDFTGITNLLDNDDYHSRRFELEIVSDDHIKIQYHGVMNGGQIASQAYDLRRAN